jgi:hypothetical protein
MAMLLHYLCWKKRTICRFFYNSIPPPPERLPACGGRGEVSNRISDETREEPERFFEWRGLGGTALAILKNNQIWIS